ncbi:unnamed protein product [Nezara viridula]|uniref:Uncharacterized protein n=1 Tax=Nezara viridula TaxID=85310 RepID=A0A9P0HCI2_NEZVI|nr:unnamed protein product [Nezara viridula]
MEDDNSEAKFGNDKLQLHVMTSFKMTFSSCGYFDLNYSLLQMVSNY